ncbi:MAG: CpaF family protein [Planctomycetaceae bacterium]
MLWKTKPVPTAKALQRKPSATPPSQSDSPTIEDVPQQAADEPVEDPVDELDAVFQRIKEEVHRKVIEKMDLSLIGTMGEGELRSEIRRGAEALLRQRPDLLTVEQRERLVEEVIDETFGLGPLEPLFRDPTISDILVNGPKTIYVERKGRLERSRISFADDRHLVRIVQRIVGAVGRRIDETSPMCDARLEDGSRVNAVIAPLAIDGTLVSIRRFSKEPLRANDLVGFGSIAPEMLQFLSACIQARMNVLISGGTGSGKTTLLNVLSGFIPVDERVATIEDAAELQLQQPHVVRMETRPANVEGHGEVTTRDLVKNALRMRPDRIIIGECRGAEALDMLQAMNTGHDGSLTTIHANTPRDAMGRLEMMVGMTGFDLPMWTIRRQIASAINIVVQAARLTGGPRRITRISEVTGMEGEMLSMHDLFVFKQTGLDEHRRAKGMFQATGIRPHVLSRLEASGITVPVELFEQRTLNV